MNNKGADQTARMRRLICAFVVRKQQSQGFLHRDHNDVEAQASWPPPGYGPDPGRRNPLRFQNKLLSKVLANYMYI